MSSGIDKLRKDLQILDNFSAQMHLYLPSDILFYPVGSGPRLTLGSYLMRQHRLLLLRDYLDSAEQNTLDHAVGRAQTIFSANLVRFEHHAHEEMDARYRQWREYLRDVNRSGDEYAAYYATSVEPRAMLEALLTQFRLPPYQLNSTVPERLATLDKSLRARWRSGHFVWPEEWQPAYPQDQYWWLYGTPI